MTNPILLAAVVAGTAVTGACATVSQRASSQGQRCDARSLQEVFSNALAFDGLRFCGSAIAFPEGISVKLFPPGFDLSERNDLVAIPGEDVEEALIRTGRTGPFEVYIEGRIRPHRGCFVRPALANGTTGCFPFRRPINIEVENYRVLP
jgi:hypothetical protein